MRLAVPKLEVPPECDEVALSQQTLPSSSRRFVAPGWLSHRHFTSGGRLGRVRQTLASLHITWFRSQFLFGPEGLFGWLSEAWWCENSIGTLLKGILYVFQSPNQVALFIRWFIYTLLIIIINALSRSVRRVSRGEICYKDDCLNLKTLLL